MLNVVDFPWTWWII